MTEQVPVGEAPPAIELRDIVKRFPGVVANDGVNLTVRTGTIHAIVGENGAGKSTLMKTLYGAHRPDEGTVAIDGVIRDFKTPRDAIDVGIGMVFQHFMLADNLRVWENIVIGDEPTSGGVWLAGRRAIARLRELSKQYGLDVDPTKLVADLGVGEKQRTEILKVIYRGARILILDEPTAVLVPHEVEELFTSLRALTDAGSTVVFISHKLDEVLKYADAITVIRAGRTVGEVPDPSKVTAHQLAEMMVGSQLPTPETRESTVTDRVALSVQHLTVTESGRAVLDDVSFDVHAGEILGIAGVEGNGQTELIHAIMNLVPSTGAIFLDGAPIHKLSTRERREAGIGYISEDRHRDGLVLPLPLWENAALGHQGSPPFSKGIWLDRVGTRQRTEKIVRDFDVRTPNISVAAFTLSGGNQQKLVVGREMEAEPRVLVAAHPTRGIDVGAQALIWDTLRDARANGLAVLLVSADLEELIGLSDRLLVMLRGKVQAELPPTVTPAELGGYMTGAASVDGAA